MTRLTTKNGSVYELDERAKKWSRTEASANSGALRSDGGRYRSATYDLGSNLVIVADPITEGAIFRIIETSKIVKLEICT